MRFFTISPFFEAGRPMSTRFGEIPSPILFSLRGKIKQNAPGRPEKEHDRKSRVKRLPPWGNSLGRRRGVDIFERS
jgi:hypothetical protein